MHTHGAQIFVQAQCLSYKNKFEKKSIENVLTQNVQDYTSNLVILNTYQYKM